MSSTLQYNSDPWIKHRYRLNDNFKESSNSMQLEGLTVNTDKWTIFPQKMLILSKFIRTVENEDGILDYEQFQQVTGEILDSSVNNYKKLKEGKIPTYNLSTLSVMKRNQLEQIAHLMNCETMHKVTSVLVHNILEKQEQIKNILKNQR